MELKGKYGTATVFTEEVESGAISQIISLLNQPMSIAGNVRIMPDCHAGAGCVIGYTAKLTDKIVPNLIGVDIGCGVIAWNLGKVAPKFDKLDKFIKANIPSGKNIHGDRVDVKLVAEVFRTIKTHFSLEEFESNMKEICERTGQSYDYVWNSLGTMGGGNHFVELDRDDNNDIWFIVHSGSRNFGLKIANFHQNVAKRAPKQSYTDKQIKSIVQKYKNTPDRGKLIQEEISRLKAAKPKIPVGLEYLEKETAANYFHDMQIAQLYAQLNRRLMGYTVVAKFYKLKFKDVEVIESVHNYINFEDKVVRKGAISAHEGEKVIIPLTMADGCLIGTGLGNEDWNFSAPHGLGRVRSRTNAKANIRLEDYQKKMRRAGVWSSCVGKKTLDEAPQAYKKPEHIIKYLKDTVDIEVQMKSIYNFKNSE